MTGKTPLNARLWERDPNDWYVEPSWCDDALFRQESFSGAIYDPFCGMGRVLDAAARAGYATLGTDLFMRCGVEQRHHVFKWDAQGSPFDLGCDIVTNPPYKNLAATVASLLACTRGKLAVLVESRRANGDKFSRWLETQPVKAIYDVSPRPSMPPGAVIVGEGKDPSGGTQDFRWIVFDHRYNGPRLHGWVRRNQG